jgi:hypothetical protein
MTSAFDKKVAGRVFADTPPIDWNNEEATVALRLMCDRLATASRTTVPPSREAAEGYKTRIREIWEANGRELKSGAPSAHWPGTNAPY